VPLACQRRSSLGSTRVNHAVHVVCKFETRVLYGGLKSKACSFTLLCLRTVQQNHKRKALSILTPVLEQMRFPLAGDGVHAASGSPSPPGVILTG
jgi:ribosomal protein S7